LNATSQYYEHARRAQDRGQHDVAIAALRRLLADDPDDARAHAMLAMSLLEKKRLVAAEHEARTALTLEPELPQARLALGVVLTQARKLDEAQALLDSVRASLPHDSAPLYFLARLRRFRGDRDGAEQLLAEARAIDPEDIDVVTALGDLAVDRGRLDEAESYARAALKLTPDGIAAHVLAGRTALARGDVDTARAHALAALKNDAVHHGAVLLLASCRARSSPLLGLWWRFNAMMWTLGEQRQIFALVATFVAARLVVIGLGETGFTLAAQIVSWAWLAWCAYTWIGPTLFRRAIERELADVRLRPGF
jgi:predicted Zn-dependent protease